MLKKYFQFLKESHLDEISNKYHSVGEYIENLTGNDDYLLNIISQYTQEIDPKIRLANAINILDKNQQLELLRRIENHVNREKQPEDIDITAYTTTNLSENHNNLAGKNMFKCFLKTITALGSKDIQLNYDESPNEFLFYFLTKNIPVSTVRSVMSRYQQFQIMTDLIEYTNNECKLYYGIKTDLNFEYGILSDTERIPIGNFKVSKGVFNWILVLDSPSAINLKKTLISLDFNSLVLMCKIKTEVTKFEIGQSTKKMKPQITDNIMTFGFYGYGKWDNGVLDAGEIENIKTNFRNFLLKYKWSDKIQISVKTNDFWIYLNIKIK